MADHANLWMEGRIYTHSIEEFLPLNPIYLLFFSPLSLFLFLSFYPFFFFSLFSPNFIFFYEILCLFFKILLKKPIKVVKGSKKNFWVVTHKIYEPNKKRWTFFRRIQNFSIEGAVNNHQFLYFPTSSNDIINGITKRKMKKRDEI